MLRRFACAGLAPWLLALLSCTSGPEAQPRNPPEPKPASTLAVYRIDPESDIRFEGSRRSDTRRGGFESFEGTIEIPDGEIERSSIEVTIDTGSLWADDPRLTRHLKTADFLDTALFPRARFTSTSVRGEGDEYVIGGNLELHGVSRPLEFPATVVVEDLEVRAQAELTLDRLDFGISYPGRAGDRIAAEVRLKLDIVARR